MLPAGIGNQVATPAVGKLMSNHINVLPVAANDGRGSESVDGVLHA